MISENIPLQIDVGDFSDEDAFAYENIGRNGKFFRAGGHDDADVGDDVEINGMFRLIDADAFKFGGKRAGDAADGNDADMYSRPEARQSLYSREGSEGNGDSVQAQIFEIGLRDRGRIAGDFVDFQSICGDGGNVARGVSFYAYEVLIANAVAHGIVNGVVDGDGSKRAHGGFAYGDEDFCDVALKVNCRGDDHEADGEQNGDDCFPSSFFSLPRRAGTFQDVLSAVLGDENPLAHTLNQKAVQLVQNVRVAAREIGHGQSRKQFLVCQSVLYGFGEEIHIRLFEHAA